MVRLEANLLTTLDTAADVDADEEEEDEAGVVDEAAAMMAREPLQTSPKRPKDTDRRARFLINRLR